MPGKVKEVLSTSRAPGRGSRSNNDDNNGQQQPESVVVNPSTSTTSLNNATINDGPAPARPPLPTTTTTTIRPRLFSSLTSDSELEEENVLDGHGRINRAASNLFLMKNVSASEDEGSSGEASRPNKLFPVQNESEELLRKVRSVLNKVSPVNYTRLRKRWLNLMPKGSDEEDDGGEPRLAIHQIAEVVHLVLAKAMEDTIYMHIYAGLMGYVVTRKPPELSKHIRHLINSQLHHELQKLTTDRELALFHRSTQRVDETRRKKVTLHRLVAELYCEKACTTKFLHERVTDLMIVNNPVDIDENVECLCVLMTFAGQKLEVEKKTWVEDIFRKLSERQNQTPPAISKRIQFMVLDLLEMRSRDWSPHNKWWTPSVKRAPERERTTSTPASASPVSTVIPTTPTTLLTTAATSSSSSSSTSSVETVSQSEVTLSPRANSTLKSQQQHHRTQEEPPSNTKTDLWRKTNNWRSRTKSEGSGTSFNNGGSSNPFAKNNTYFRRPGPELVPLTSSSSSTSTKQVFNNYSSGNSYNRSSPSPPPPPLTVNYNRNMTRGNNNSNGTNPNPPPVPGYFGEFQKKKQQQHGQPNCNSKQQQPRISSVGSNGANNNHHHPHHFYHPNSNNSHIQESNRKDISGNGELTPHQSRALMALLNKVSPLNLDKIAHQLYEVLTRESMDEAVNFIVDKILDASFVTRSHACLIHRVSVKPNMRSFGAKICSRVIKTLKKNPETKEGFQFLAELYNLNMISVQDVRDALEWLMNCSPSMINAAMECLVIFLFISGAKLDAEMNDEIWMNCLIEFWEKKANSVAHHQGRSLCLLRDVMELRANKWAPNRQLHWIPPTIDLPTMRFEPESLIRLFQSDRSEFLRFIKSGTSSLSRIDKFWKEALQFAVRNGNHERDPQFLKVTGTCIRVLVQQRLIRRDHLQSYLGAFVSEVAHLDRDNYRAWNNWGMIMREVY